MSRQLIDGLIILAVIVLGASHLSAQAFGRKVVRTNPAGSAQHQSGRAVRGANGSASSSGSMAKSADGTVSGSRDTTAAANSGATYDGTTTYDQDSGAAHTGTCTNAAGEVVACVK